MQSTPDDSHAAKNSSSPALLVHAPPPYLHRQKRLEPCAVHDALAPVVLHRQLLGRFGSEQLRVGRGPRRQKRPHLRDGERKRDVLVRGGREREGANE
jgi:hypothetical protein